MYKKFGMPLKLLLALLSALLRVVELTPLFSKRMEGFKLRFHVSDKTISYMWMSGEKEAGYLCYDFRNGVFMSQNFPPDFSPLKRAETYIRLLSDCIRIIKRMKEYEKP